MEDILDDDLRLELSPSIENTKKILSLRAEYAKSLKSTKYGRNALLAIIIMEVFGCLIQLGQGLNDPYIIGVSVIIILILIGLYVLAFYRPYVGLLSALIFYILIHLLAIIVDPMSIVRGILIKIIVFYYLIGAIGPSRKLSDIKKELEIFGVTAI